MRTRRSLQVHREVFAMAWPLTIGMLSYTAMTVADSLFVGQLGTAPLAGVGLAASAVHLFVALPHGLLGGARVHVARAFGAEDLRRARAMAWQALWIAAAAGVLGVLVAPLAGGYLTVLGASAEVTSHGEGYLFWRFLGMPALFTVFGLQVWFQGTGDARTPMVAAVVGNAVNIALDPVLIHGWLGAPALGAAGAGAATAVACAVQALVLAVRGGPVLWPHRMGLRRALVDDLVGTGLPLGTHALLDVAAFAVFGALLAGVGEAHVAAHVIVVRVLMVSFLPGAAVAEAATVLVGQRLGAGRPASARRVWLAATAQAVGFMAALGVVFLLVPQPLIGGFGAQPDVADIAVDVLALAAFVQVFDAVAMVGVGCLAGAGRTRATLVLGLSAAWLVKVPVAAWATLGLGLGAWGAWLGIFAELVVVAVASVALLQRGAWGRASSLRGAIPSGIR